jgi:hypothetical protein
MHHSSRLAVCSTALLLAACAKSEPAKDTAAAMAPAPTPAAAPAPAHALSLADVAGKWKVTTMGTDAKDTTVTTAILVATADTTGWSLELPTGKKVPMHVTVAGDTLLTKSDVYPSVRRKGKKVWSSGSLRLENGKLVGTTVGHYLDSGADSVLTLRTEGVKLP